MVELADTPDAIRVPEDLEALLARLAARLEGRLAIVSGRAVADLLHHLGDIGVAISGSHGLELRLSTGAELPLAVSADLTDARASAAAFAAAHPGLLLEEKPLGLAMHYRARPATEGEVARFMDELAATTGLVIQRGKMVVELRPSGFDKGDAIRRLMTEPEFVGATPLFLGDDVTDEDGFEAAAELSGGGVLVGAERGTAARWRLDDVSAASAWLRAAAAR